ncbi:MAG TPA: hypothetical protein VN776_07315 [Terracidiphilus sp.]|nr:hypothetical protein [Terracidiphilus sp.]
MPGAAYRARWSRSLASRMIAASIEEFFRVLAAPSIAMNPEGYAQNPLALEMPIYGQR